MQIFHRDDTRNEWLFIVIATLIIIGCRPESMDLLPDSGEGILKDGRPYLITSSQLYNYARGNYIKECYALKTGDADTAKLKVKILDLDSL